MTRKKIFLMVAVALTMASCGGNKTDNDASANEKSEEATEVTEVVAEGTTATDSVQTPAEKKEATAEENSKSAEAKPETYTLTPKGLGPITLGMKKSDIPSSIPGLYDSKNYNAYDHNGDDIDVPLNHHGWMLFTLQGKKQFYVTFDNSGKAVQISVQSSSIPTSLGITTASPVAKVAALPGAVMNGDIDAYEVGGFTIYVDDRINSIVIGE